MADFVDAIEEARATADMIIERHPEMREAIEEKLAEAMGEVAAIFQPYVDLANGVITEEEFAAIRAERAAADEAARLAMWGEPDDPDDPEWEVPCETCGATVLFDELPPQWVECEECGNAEPEPDEEDEP